VLSTAGNVLIGEAIHFGKPILALPEDAFEQRLNAYMIERMGVGMRGDLRGLTPSDVDRFMGNHDYYGSNMKEHAGDSRADAIVTLQRYIAELGGERQRAGKTPRRSRERAPMLPAPANS
jgi:UDP:flavonoid glycosyltransferase YjiC (YdhE family)